MSEKVKCPRGCNIEPMERTDEEKKRYPMILFDYFCPKCGCFFNA